PAPSPAPSSALAAPLRPGPAPRPGFPQCPRPRPHYISHNAQHPSHAAIGRCRGASLPPRGAGGCAMLRALRRCCPRAAAGPGPGFGPGPGLWLVPSRGRKSREDPPAKSKASRLKLPPPVDPLELFVVTERYRQHRLVLSALRSEFRAEVKRKKQEALAGGEDAAEHVEEHRLLMAWNDAENARQRARREERLRKEEEERKRQKLEAEESKARLMEAFVKEKEKEVLQLQEEAKTFITPENLDARIEECLDNPRNYNFAIDKEGRIVKRTVLP
ncbi:RT26 protein, partial [Crypturellus soui]|nr:RT26 protein [Crypturellus soui]